MKRPFLIAAVFASIALQAQSYNGYPSDNSYSNQANCSNLTMAEKQFANRLSNDNKMIFCNQMNSAQRSKCMRMMGQEDDYGNPTSADMAVVMVYNDMSQSYGNNSMNQADCSNLNAMEKKFANRLSNDNKMIFCNQMTPSQRSKCLKMMGQLDQDGNPMTEDGAVMMVSQGMSQSYDNTMNSSMNNSMNQSDCSNLTMQEKRFASRLNNVNKMTFCSKMTASQRSESMRMMGGTDENGNLITEDQAVMLMMPSDNMSQSYGNSMNQSDCSNMTSQEKKFSSRLSNSNKMIFCNQMTPAQRSQSMKMVGKLDENGNPMTEDNAVMRVYQGMSSNSMNGNCSNMTRAEQQFSNLLNPTNKTTFCNKMTPQQRSKAMQMTGQLDANGVPMSADRAVMKVVQEKTNQPSGACPVK